MNNKTAFFGSISIVSFFIGAVVGIQVEKVQQKSIEIKLDPTFEKSKYYKEWECWKYRRDTADYNRDYLFSSYVRYKEASRLGIKLESPTEYYANENEQIRSEQQMERLKRLFRKDQSPCK